MEKQISTSPTVNSVEPPFAGSETLAVPSTQNGEGLPTGRGVFAGSGTANDRTWKRFWAELGLFQIL